MAFRYFLGRSQEWLEAQLQQAQEDLAAGKTLSSWGNAGDSASKQIQISAHERIRMLLNDLNAIDPDNYPSTSIRRIRTTVGKIREA